MCVARVASKCESRLEVEGAAKSLELPSPRSDLIHGYTKTPLGFLLLPHSASPFFYFSSFPLFSHIFELSFLSLSPSFSVVLSLYIPLAFFRLARLFPKTWNSGTLPNTLWLRGHRTRYLHNIGELLGAVVTYHRPSLVGSPTAQRALPTHLHTITPTHMRACIHRDGNTLWTREAKRTTPQEIVGE